MSLILCIQVVLVVILAVYSIICLYRFVDKAFQRSIIINNLSLSIGTYCIYSGF
jgi:hypothetical protein